MTEFKYVSFPKEPVQECISVGGEYLCSHNFISFEADLANHSDWFFSPSQFSRWRYISCGCVRDRVPGQKYVAIAIHRHNVAPRGTKSGDLEFFNEYPSFAHDQRGWSSRPGVELERSLRIKVWTFTCDYVWFPVTTSIHFLSASSQAVLSSCLIRLGPKRELYVLFFFLSFTTHPGWRFTWTCLDFETVSHFFSRLNTPFKLCGAAVARFHGWVWLKCVTISLLDKLERSCVTKLLAPLIIFEINAKKKSLFVCWWSTNVHKWTDRTREHIKEHKIYQIKK